MTVTTNIRWGGCLSAVFYKFGDIFYPTPTLALPLKGRGISMFLLLPPVPTY
jgi:hypothetical protein